MTSSRWMALPVVLFLSSGMAKAETMLFRDDFSGSAVIGLNGLSPDVTSGGAKWVSSSIFSANGGIASNDPGSATLAFTPKVNHAVSPDGGVTWQKSDGAPYTGTITQSTSDLVVPIPQGYSYINQTSMTVDMNNRPVVASRWAPAAGSGNDQAQQMLEWFDGTDWQVSQITTFAPGLDLPAPSTMMPFVFAAARRKARSR